ncbi:MAG TPA: hypothetical protein VGH59_11090 [Casimicrobiaceae bacterium]|jgi:hypothetical protein
MYSDDDLSAAVQAGILTEDAAQAFRAHVAQRKSAPALDEEHFRLVTGFNDIFVVIACLLMLASVAWLGGAIAPPLGALAVSAVAWALGEFFILRRRMALPAIVLLLAFTGGIVAAGFVIDGKSTAALALACAIAAVATWLHWRRFHVPITVAAGAAAVVGCAVSLLLVFVPATKAFTNLLSLLAGVVVFALAMRWDSADTRRETRKSDVAFWLHLLAAPLLVRPIFSALDVFAGATDLRQAIAVVAVYVAIAIVSLSIDRRALMVSALIYVLYTFSDLLRQYGVVSLGFAIAAFVIGSGLLLLSAFWHPARARAIGFFPDGLRHRLPPLR